MEDCTTVAPNVTPITSNFATEPHEAHQERVKSEIALLESKIASLKSALKDNEPARPKASKDDHAIPLPPPPAPQLQIGLVLKSIALCCVKVLGYWSIAFLIAAIGGAILTAVENNYTRDAARDQNAAVAALNLTDSQLDLFSGLGAFADETNAPGGWWLCTEFIAFSLLNIAKGPPPMIHRNSARTFVIFWTIVFIPVYLVLFVAGAKEVVSTMSLIRSQLSGGVATKHSQSDMLSMFDAYDEDKDGVLDLMELQAFLCAISDGKKPDWDDLKAIMEECDEDHTKTVDRTEFMEVVTLWSSYVNSAGKPPDVKLLVMSFLFLVVYTIIGAAISRSIEDWDYGIALFFTWMTLLGTGPGMYPTKTNHQVFYVISGFVSMGLLAIIGDIVVEMAVANASKKDRKLQAQIEAKRNLSESKSKGRILLNKAFDSFKRFVIALSVCLIFLGVTGVCLQYFELKTHKQNLQSLYDGVYSSGLNDVQMAYLDDNGLIPDPSTSYWTWVGTAWYIWTFVSTEGYGAFSPVTSGGQLFLVVISVPGFVIAMYTFFTVADSYATFVNWVMHYVLRKNKKEDDMKRQFDMSFQAIDKDGSGVIDYNELKELLESLTGTKVDETDVKYVFNTADSDKSGELTQNEVLVAVMLWNTETETLDFPLHIAILSSATVLTIVLFFISAAIYKGLESAQGWTYMESMWFNYCTVFMLGYGDYWPKTKAGQIFNFFSLVMSWGLMLTIIQESILLVKNRINDYRREQEVQKESRSNSAVDIPSAA